MGGHSLFRCNQTCSDLDWLPWHRPKLLSLYKFILNRFWLKLCSLLNLFRIHSWDQPLLCHEEKVSCSKKQLIAADGVQTHALLATDTSCSSTVPDYTKVISYQPFLSFIISKSFSKNACSYIYKVNGYVQGPFSYSGYLLLNKIPLKLTCRLRGLGVECKHLILVSCVRISPDTDVL